MDFVQGIGERYLIGKANATPQMLENLAKKQFKSTTDPKAEAAQASALPTSDKDEEIAKLRKELAETKLKSGKASGEANSARRQPVPPSTKSMKSEKSTAHASAARSGGGSAKATTGREMKGSVPPSIASEARSGAPKEKKPSEPARGRRASISTATAAAKAHKATSEANSGGYALPRPGNVPNPQALRTVSAKGALQEEKSVRKAAASASSAHASSTNRRHSVGPQSKVGSEDESRGAVVATRPPSLPPPPPRSIHDTSRERGGLYDQVVARPTHAYEVEEPGPYFIVVEEDLPTRKNSTRYQGGHGGVVEVQHRRGRTVYRVT